MANPMREKRTWPPDRDSDGETAAAFEAAVAVVKESVVRSGEVLSSAKEDLTDHHRWLKAQAAAVESDRERLGRWLQRQRERQESIERREQARGRRRAKREAAIGSVRGAIAGALFAVRNAVFRTISSIVGGLNAIDATAARALRFIGASVRDTALYVAAAVRRATVSLGIRIRRRLSLRFLFGRFGFRFGPRFVRVGRRSRRVQTPTRGARDRQRRDAGLRSDRGLDGQGFRYDRASRSGENSLAVGRSRKTQACGQWGCCSRFVIRQGPCACVHAPCADRRGGNGFRFSLAGRRARRQGPPG